MHNVFSFLLRKKAALKRILPLKLLRTVKNKLMEAEISRYREKPIDRSAFRQMPFGVNLIGDIRAEIGLGQSMRLIAGQLHLSKYDFGIFNFQIADNVRRNDHTCDSMIREDTPYSINLFHINPQEMGLAYFSMDKKIWRNRYNIAFWLWELEEFPKDYIDSIKFVDEIWTPSEFTSRCIRKVTNKPVYTIPYYVTVESARGCGRANFGLPADQFLYLVMFDSNSTMLRKNPVAAIEAFKRAFDNQNEDVGLVIKVNNPNKKSLDALRERLNGYSNVYYITEILDKPKVNSLIECVDVFVSLHRAEGFGLVMAEAMLLKTACIATNWSSNTEFMDADSACMVPCEMIQIDEGEGCYPEGSTWADPSVEAASAFMRRLKEDPVFYTQLTERAFAHVAEVLGKEKIVGLMEDRISQIGASISEEIYIKT